MADAITGALPKSITDVLAQLPRLFGCSRFAAELCAREPQLLLQLVERDWLDVALSAKQIADDVAAALVNAPDEIAFMRQLRIVRQRHMLRLVWRAMILRSDIKQELLECSALADSAIRVAVAYVEANSGRAGRACREDGTPQALITLAMGKLGGRELNFSSDVDLIFFFAEHGETDGARELSNEQHFSKLVQRVGRILSDTTSDGFVFRMDTRLRPFGDSGALVHSLDALELYLQRHGRNWERYAYVKARAITGDPADLARLAQIRDPFVYRRYLDYRVFESLREMHELIAREVARRDLRDDLKRGPGGIREIEFIVQSLQLLRGGADKRLRSRHLMDALNAQLDGRLMAPEMGERLGSAYLFLRRLENLVQMLSDEQRHALPADPQRQAALACAMGLADWAALRETLSVHRDVVAQDFRMLLRDPQEDGGAEADSGGVPDSRAAASGAPSPEVARRPGSNTAPGSVLVGVWDGSLSADRAQKLVRAEGVEDAAAVVKTLRKMAAAGWYARLPNNARKRLHRLLPRVIAALAGRASAANTLGRVLQVLQAVTQRSVYLALLSEQPAALAQLVNVCALSSFVARQLVNHPMLLDELLDPRLLDARPSRAQLAQELEHRFAGLEENDLEAQMEHLRQFQQAALFRVTVSDLAAGLDIMKVSDALTDIAELVLQLVFELALNHLRSRYGDAMNGDQPARFAIVGYGKLGGIELGYGSDLDLVFLHESVDAQQLTTGPRPIANAVFFARLASRLIHLLSTPTVSGVLYEVDTRLRPSGNAGLLVSSVRAFETYQRERAWTWEHQALLRARAVAGDAQLCGEFEVMRRRLLCQPREPAQLQARVREMRQRMREHLSRSDPDHFDIKQDAGGLADIEFMVQYLVLAAAANHPQLVDYTDNIRQLEGLANAGLVPLQVSALLIDSYREYRQQVHRLALAGAPPVVPEAMFAPRAAQIRELRERILGAD